MMIRYNHEWVCKIANSKNWPVMCCHLLFSADHLLFSKRSYDEAIVAPITRYVVPLLGSLYPFPFVPFPFRLIPVATPLLFKPHSLLYWIIIIIMLMLNQSLGRILWRMRACLPFLLWMPLSFVTLLGLHLPTTHLAFLPYGPRSTACCETYCSFQPIQSFFCF